MVEGTDDLTSAVTTAVNPDGSPVPSLSGLTDVLDSVWAVFFGATTVPGGTNWNAYSHQQLYDMLWQGADPGDVNAVADEWGRHSSALTGTADALRGQGSTLRENWQGRAADSAANRLGELSDRVWNAGARAGQVQKAAGGAGDALAVARSTMPKPPADPLTLMTSAVGAGPMPPLDAIAVGATRLFTGDATAGMAKAQAVKVMQAYEASLMTSSHQVAPAAAGATTANTFGAGAANPQTTSLSGFSGGAAAIGQGVPGGVPWSRLTGGAAPSTGGMPGVGIGPGPISGVAPPTEDAAAAGDIATEPVVEGEGGYMSPTLGRNVRNEEDKQHRRRLPNVNNRLFAPDERATVPVIGENTDKERDGGR